jgi:hypothetical protein
MTELNEGSAPVPGVLFGVSPESLENATLEAWSPETISDPDLETMNPRMFSFFLGS